MKQFAQPYGRVSESPMSFSDVNSALQGVAQTHVPIRGGQTEFIVQLDTAMKEQYLVQRN
jgi:hypothetical protein